MQKSTLKRIGGGIGILIIGIILGYILGGHRNDPRNDAPIYHDKFMPHMNPNTFQDFNKMFNDIEREQIKQISEIKKEFNNLENNEFSLELGELTGNYNQQGIFIYHEMKDINGNKSSYDISGNRKEGENSGDIIINGKNNQGKTFTYSGNLINGISKGELTDGSGNSKNLNLENINLGELINKTSINQ